MQGSNSVPSAGAEPTGPERVVQPAASRRRGGGRRHSGPGLGPGLGSVLALLGVSAVALATGGVLRAVGAGPAANAAWTAVGAAGAALALWETVQALRQGRFGVDVIAVLALVGAILAGESLASAVIAIMVMTGRVLEAWASDRARRNLRLLLERAPTSVRRYTQGALETVEVTAVVPGDLVMVTTGEVVPVDGRLVSAALLDESALTGEPLPVERAVGEPVQSGVANAGAPFDLRATARADDSAYSALVRLVRSAEASRAPSVRLADRYALWFLLFTLALAGGGWVLGGVGRAVAILVVATPCPLILGVPVALVAGLSRAARHGVVVKSGAALERLAACTTVLLDKTGTVTSGQPTVTQVASSGAFSPEEVLRLAGCLEQASAHVLAGAVVRAAVARGLVLSLPQSFEEVHGSGARGSVDGRSVSVGNREWVGLRPGPVPAWAAAAHRRSRVERALLVYVAVDGGAQGVMVLEDPVRVDAARTVRSLRSRGIKRVVMVTGDRDEVAQTVGEAIGVDQVYAQCTPGMKLQVVEAEKKLAPTMMVGDGINDAPALALADVGVAMASRGATVSSEGADVVLTVDRFSRMGEARSIANRARGVAAQSAAAGMALSLVAMVVASWGVLPALWGALLQEVIDVAAISNALRALRPARDELRLSSSEKSLTSRFRTEHQAIEAATDRLRVVADRLAGDRLTAGAGPAMDDVSQVYSLLVTKVVPHEEAEEQLLYPVIDQLLGGTDPTGPMSRAHVEISTQVRRLGDILGTMADAPPDEADLAELRRALYGLEAVLRLHTAQEEEHYLSLGQD